MRKKFSSLIEYITWLYKHNLETQKTVGAFFRIIKTEKNKNGNNILEIQVINKSTTFKCSANDIAAQNRLLECFSKSDVRLITYLATEELFAPKNKIVGLEFDDKLERTILKIKSKESDDFSFITADKVTVSSELLKNLSQEDAHKAGYLMAVEQMLLEKAAIEKCKASN